MPLKPLEVEVRRFLKETGASAAPSRMLGTWFVVQTTCPFWRKRRNPRMFYENAAADGGRFDEHTHYGPPGRSADVTGTNTVDPALPTRFCWRGTQWFSRLLTCDWYYLAHDPDYDEWAVTYYGKTWFSAAGIDIVARRPTLDPATVEAIVGRFRDYPLLRRSLKGRFAARHDPSGPDLA